MIYATSTRQPMNLALRFRSFFISSVVACAPLLSQTASAPHADSGDILAELAPDNVPPQALHLYAAQRTRAIRQLVKARQKETGWHREIAAYLLATLGSNYTGNRDELLKIWRKDGDDGTMELLIDLYGQGHQELLHPLLARFDGWNAATSEGLGTFYSEELEKHPSEFLSVLATFTPARQLELCTAAGNTDGGGMGPVVERKVLANLGKIGGEVAVRCARGVRQGNKDADEANSDIEQSDPAVAPAPIKHP
jgi:hypothetical protein